MRHGFVRLCLTLAAVIVAAGCDTVEPVDDSRLVIQGFLDSGKPLPAILVRRTLTPSQAYDDALAAVSDASLELVVGERRIAYAAERGHPGVYVPDVTDDFRPVEGATFSFQASWRESVAEASGIVPPEIRIEDVALTAPNEPVSAVLLDSLALTDSLATGAYTGYIFPVEVTVHWIEDTLPAWSSADSWVRVQLKPYASFSSPVVDLFLRSHEILREGEQEQSESGMRSWTGVYAVGVARKDDPMPEHFLRVSLVRSGPDYAQFAASKDSPERREPISNLDGAVGIFTAISVDSTRVHVSP